MSIEELKKLGWEYSDTWCNRDFYYIGNSKCSIFEHNGRFGLENVFEEDSKDYLNLLYCNLTDDEIREFTDLVKTALKIESNPKDFTLYDYLTSQKNLITFIKKRK